VCLNWRAMRVLSAAWRTARPKQWTKNLLVIAAPLAAGELFEPGVAVSTAGAFVAFCLMSSAVYHVNDVADRAADRVHPRKVTRPVASGAMSVQSALVVATLLALASLAVSWTTQTDLVLVVAAYGVVQVIYTFWLKHEPVMDIMVVTLGFLMRAVAGGLAASLPISQWFLLVAGFGSLFMVAGKRYSEVYTLGSEAGTRRSLVRYTDTYLRFVWSMAAAATVMSYSLWAFEMSAGTSQPWHMASIGAFVLGLMRYAVDIDAGTAAEPEDIVLADRVLQGIGVVWLLLVVLGIMNA
jgi:decaprenyl-phosphate phosphoribosyltransferase